MTVDDKPVSRRGSVAVGLLLIFCVALLLTDAGAHAASATWGVGPASGSWNSPGNWNPGAIPNSPNDIATFAVSNSTSISISGTIQVSSIVFSRNGSAFTLTATPGALLTLDGTGASTGITNSSGLAQNFVTAVDGNGDFGSILFQNRATAGTLAKFTNNGATVFGSNGGITAFTGNAGAAAATIVDNGGTVFGAGGGSLQLSGSATTGAGAITNNGGTSYGASGGTMQISGNSSTVSVTITNNPGLVAGAGGGGLQFSNNSDINSGTIRNNGGTAVGEGGGFALFSGNSFADAGAINNNGGTAAGATGGYTQFSGSSDTVINVTITNNGATAAGAGGGYTQFADESFSSSANIHNLGGAASGESGGFAQYFAYSSAFNATIFDTGGAASGATGGSTQFSASASAYNAVLTNTNSTASGAGAGNAQFYDFSTAGTSKITNVGAAVSGANAGFTQFFDDSSAGSATITNSGGIGSAPGGSTAFYDSANAGTATITGSNGASVQFYDTSSAGSAKIITNKGAQLDFNDNSSAGNATLTGTGGGIYFLGQSSGGTALVSTTGTFDISGLTDGGMSIGMIQSSGTFYLGGNTLTVGGLALSGTVSGVISGGGRVSGTGGGLVKIGSGTLALTGSNTYTGATTVDGGTLNLGAGTATGSINSGAPLVVGGGIILFTRTGGVTQVFGSTTIASGSSSIDDLVSSDTLKLGAISRSAGGTVDFTTETGSVTTSSSNTFGILGGYATFAGSTWAVSNGASSPMTGLPSLSYITTTTASNTAASYSNQNIDVTSSPSPASGITPNSLRFNAAAAETLTLTGANVVNSGGILVTGTVANRPSVINGGTLQGPSGGDLIVIENDPSNSLTISSLIVDGTTPTGLTKSGGGLLVLSNQNTYSGPTIVDAGTLQLSNDSPGSYTGPTVINMGAAVHLSDLNALQNSTVTINAGAVGLVFDYLVNLAGMGQPFALGGLAGNGNLSLIDNASAPVALTVGQNNQNTTYGGVISSGTASSLSMIGSGTLILTGSSTYTGTTIVNGGGTLQIGDGVTRGASIAASNTSGPVAVSNGSCLGIDLVNGETFRNDINLSGGGNLEFLASGINYLAGAIQDDGAGVIMQSGSGTTIYTGDGGLNTLDGSSFSGTVQVNGGTFQLGDNGRTLLANLGTGQITVNPFGPPVSGSSTFAVALADGESFSNSVTLDNGGILEFVASGDSYTISVTNYLACPGRWHRLHRPERKQHHHCQCTWRIERLQR